MTEKHEEAEAGKADLIWSGMGIILIVIIAAVEHYA